MTSYPPADKHHPGQERRQHPRIEKHFIITYYDLDKVDAEHCISQIKNISRGGVCFSSSIAFAPGSRLQTMIKTPYMGQAINFEVRVIDCEEKIPNTVYNVRAKIENKTPQAEEILHKIEESFLRSQSNY